MKTNNTFTLIFILASLNYSYGQTQQITYYTPIDSIRIDSTEIGNEEYSLAIDSIGTDGLFYKGMGNYFYFDNSSMNYQWYESSEYDINKRKTKHKEWSEINGIAKYFVNESFAYDAKGRRIFYSNSANNQKQNVSWTYTEFDSLASQTSLVYDLTSSITTGNKYEYDYYLNHQLSHKISSLFTAGNWTNVTEENYFYGNNGIPDTVLTSKAGIPCYRELIYKNTTGRDSFIVFQSLDQSNNTWVANYSDQFIYDSIGKLVKQNRWFGLPVNLFSDFEQTWLYNSYGQLLKNETFYKGGSGNQRNYTYYSNGRPYTYFYDT